MWSQVNEDKFSEVETVKRFIGNSRFRTDSRQLNTAHEGKRDSASFPSIVGYSVSHGSVFQIN